MVLFLRNAIRKANFLEKCHANLRKKFQRENTSVHFTDLISLSYHLRPRRQRTDMSSLFVLYFSFRVILCVFLRALRRFSLTSRKFHSRIAQLISRSFPRQTARRQTPRRRCALKARHVPIPRCSPSIYHLISI